MHAGGQDLRERTAAWLEANAERLSLNGSLEKVLEAYRSAQNLKGQSL